MLPLESLIPTTLFGYNFNKDSIILKFNSIDQSILKTILWYSNNKAWFNYTRKKYDGRRLGIK